jgi:type IV pilus assembly protein PilM
VRAAEVETTKDGRYVLRRYAQVGLPHGYVVDGEIINVPGVSTALKRLWLEGGFEGTKVVLGISGPRVFVRQADVPASNTQDLRSSLKFDAQDLIPIPMEDASFDFSVLDKGEAPVGDAKQIMRILIVAAHRELLRTHLAALKGAGLNAIAMDASPLALMRVVPTGDQAGLGGVEVLVSIGAELTTVAVRENGVPRFIRSLTVGGAKLTEMIANTMHLEMAVAERLKRGSVPADTPQSAQARKAMSAEMRDLAEEVRATVDFFVSQSEGATIDRLLITGGASQTEGLAASIAGNLPVTVRQIDPFASLTVGDFGFNPEEMKQAAATSATAIGHALWGVESPLIRLSVLPDEVVAAQRARRLVIAAACGVAGLAGVLALVGAGQVIAVHSEEDQVHQDQRQMTALTAHETKLQAATVVAGELKARAALETGALAGDVDWVRVLGQLAAVMPANLSLTSFTGTRSNLGATSSSASSTTEGIGTVNFSVTGGGGLPAAANWVLGLQRDPDLEGTWVTGISVKVNGGPVTFSSTAIMTGVAESNRAQEVQQ